MHVEVRVSRLRFVGEGKTRAYVDIVIDNSLAIHGVRLVEGQKGFFLSFPSTKWERDGRYYAVVHPVSKEAREAIWHAVLGEFQRQAEAARGGLQR